MANLTVSSVEPALLTSKRSEWGGHGDGRDPRQAKRRNARLGIVAALLPGRDPEEFEVEYEIEAGAMVGLVIRELASGRIVAALGRSELEARDQLPGTIIERRA